MHEGVVIVLLASVAATNVNYFTLGRICNLMNQRDWKEQLMDTYCEQMFYCANYTSTFCALKIINNLGQ